MSHTTSQIRQRLQKHSTLVIGPSLDKPPLRKWPLSCSIFRDTPSHFLPPLSGRSPVNCFSECGPVRKASYRESVYQDLGKHYGGTLCPCHILRSGGYPRFSLMK